MKIALITDTHFGARNDSLSFNEYFYQFWENTFFPYLKENKIDKVIHLGDVMDRRKFVSYKIAKDFRTRFIQPFADNNIDLHILIGNHDTYFKNTNAVNSIEELLGGRYPTIKYYSESETVDFDGFPIHFVPWINSENYHSTIEKIDETRAQLCMGHLEINGFEMHSGHKSENGYSKDIFKKFDTVFSGHFHKKSDDGQVFYLGNTYQITWSDYNCQKGFHVFDTETRGLERVINPHTIFEKIYYDDSVNDYSKYNIKSCENKYVKLIVVNKKDLYQFDRFVERLLEEKTHEVKIVEDFSELDARNVSDEIVENSQDTMTLLERYVDELDIDVDKNRLKNTMKSLYVEAIDLEI